jgi:hypothetical protein
VKLPEPYTHFVDRSPARGIVIEVLRAAGETVVAHDDCGTVAKILTA